MTSALATQPAATGISGATQLFLGGRFTRLREADPAPHPVVLRADAPAAAVPVTWDLAEDAGPATLLPVTPSQQLTAVALLVEESVSDLLALDEPCLAPELRCRAALVTLRRRADRHGKVLVLRYRSRELRALARAAGWQAEPLPAAPRASEAGHGEMNASRAALPARSRGRALPALPVLPALPRFGFSLLRRAQPARPAARHQDGERVPSRGSGWAASERVGAAERAGRYGAARGDERSGSAAWAGPDRWSGATSPAARRMVAARRRPAALPRVSGSVAGALAGAGLLLAAVLVVYPSATVTVVPTTQALALDVTVTVDPDAKAADPATGRLPGRAVTREASDTATAPATGKKTVPDAKASGEVVLLNQSEKAVTAPRGTIVTAGAVRFETQTEVTVSPSRVAGGARNFGMSTVKVQAVAGGASGNVERTQITRVEGPLAAQLSVQNNAATRGGTDRAITYVTADDRAKLQDQLTKALVERVNQQLKVQPVSTDKETAVPWTPSGPAVTEATFSKNVDEEAQSVSLTLKVRYGATVFANDAYNILVKQVGSNQARAAAGGVAPLQDTVQADPPVVQGVDGTGVVRLAGRARATVGAPLDRNAIRSAVAGKSDGEARAYLATVPGTAGFDVKSFGWPGGRLPWLGWRITVGTAGTAGGR